MSIDAALLGRQKKWKFIILMLFLAVLSLAMALSIRNKERLRSSLPVGDGEIIWSNISAGTDVQTTVTDSGVYVLTKDRLLNLEAPFRDLDVPVSGASMAGGFCLVLYRPLDRELYLPETGGQISLPGRITRLSVGRERYLTAILSASGYRTKTVVFTDTGEIIGEIPLRDKTMVEAVFLQGDSSLAALCLSEDGEWECGIYSPEGELMHRVFLQASVCYDLLPMHNNAAVSTDQGIYIVSADGGLASVISEQANLWAASDHYLAVISDDTLKTYTPDGKLLGTAALNYYPNSIAVSGNRIYIHFGEGVGCYTSYGKELWFRKDGSMALAIQPDSSGVVLIPFYETS